MPRKAAIIIKIIFKLIVIKLGHWVFSPSSDSISENVNSSSVFSSNVIDAFPTICPAYS